MYSMVMVLAMAGAPEVPSCDLGFKKCFKPAPVACAPVHCAPAPVVHCEPAPVVHCAPAPTCAPACPPAPKCGLFGKFKSCFTGICNKGTPIAAPCETVVTTSSAPACGTVVIPPTVTPVETKKEMPKDIKKDAPKDMPKEKAKQ